MRMKNSAVLVLTAAGLSFTLPVANSFARDHSIPKSVVLLGNTGQPTQTADDGDVDDHDDGDVDDPDDDFDGDQGGDSGDQGGDSDGDGGDHDGGDGDGGDHDGGGDD